MRSINRYWARRSRLTSAQHRLIIRILDRVFVALAELHGRPDLIRERERPPIAPVMFVVPDIAVPPPPTLSEKALFALKVLGELGELPTGIETSEKAIAGTTAKLLERHGLVVRIFSGAKTRARITLKGREYIASHILDVARNA